ncbi:hypothetical protein AAD018_006475 [Aestuariibius insulae]|uniref:hypothetical protein n=1 Tax=Aestuariibius insulae TaxID=2058287 RepID=UPI00345EA4A0
MDDDVEDYLTVATAELGAAKRILTEAIRDYPTPISGCDVQFNHLLSQRKAVDRALSALRSEPFIPTPRLPDQGLRVESR